MKARNQLIKLAAAVVCFLDEHGIPYASIPSGPLSHRCFPVTSAEVRHHMYGEFDKNYNEVPGTTAYRELIHMLEARAHASELPRRSLDTRIAADGPRFKPETIYLNLANDTAGAIEISSRGWNLRPAKSTYFRGSAQMLPLPAPEADGPSCDTLLEKLTGLPAAVREHCLAWIVSAMRPTGPYPILVLKGPTGSGKSTLARLLRHLVDPSIDPLPNLPNTPGQLHTYAELHRVLAFDHVTHIARRLSEALCCTAKPVILTMPDRTPLDPELTSRAIIVELPEIQPERRRTEAEISATFHTVHPQFIGALCTLVSRSLANLADTKPSALPRHADAAVWIAAAQVMQQIEPATQPGSGAIRWTACSPPPRTPFCPPPSPAPSPGPAGST